MRRPISVIVKLNLFLALLLVSTAVLALAVVLQGVERALAVGLLIAWVALAAAGLALRLSIREGILRSIRGASRVITRVTEGDLTARVDIQAQGETQRMLDGLQRMTDDLRGIVTSVGHSARSVADASAQIAQGNRELSTRTEEQAAALEQTASAMEELTSTVGQNAQNAQHVSQFADDASAVARQGQQAMGAVVETMQAITQASARIRDIVALIDGIAFQTNILALNAAVEAARAGEQGRGFAVVASEVRVLAQRSAEAAKEIRGLIDGAASQVEAGAKRVEAAGDTMTRIVQAVQKVREHSTQIAGASREQTAGIGEVGSAVMKMERVVQQDAALVEEAAAATAALADEAHKLRLLVERFHVGEGGEPAPVPKGLGAQARRPSSALQVVSARSEAGG